MLKSEMLKRGKAAGLFMCQYLWVCHNIFLNRYKFTKKKKVLTASPQMISNGEIKADVILKKKSYVNMEF